MMSSAAEEIWAILRELAESQKETDRRFRKTTEELDKRFEETDRKFRQTTEELDKRFEETDRKFRQTIEELDKRFEETDRRFRETDKKFQYQIKEVNRAIGKLGHRLGDFVEDAVRPAAIDLFREKGIDVHVVYQNVEVKCGNEALEIDLLVINQKDMVVIECKSQLTIEDIQDHLERLGKLKRLTTEYAHKRVMGAVAGMSISDQVLQYAIRKGLYVIGQSGKQLVIWNNDHFVPAVW